MKNMKPIFIALAMLFLSLGLKAETDSLTISGTLTGLEKNKVVISFTDENGKNQYLSAQGVNDRFVVRVPLQRQPVAARLSVSLPYNPSAGHEMPRSPFNFFIWNKDLVIQGKASTIISLKVRGDAENNLYNELVQQTAGGELRYQELLQQMINSKSKLSPPDSAARSEEIHKISMENYKKQKAFVRAHPDAFASVFLLSRMENLYSADHYVEAWKSLAPTYKNTVLGQGIQKSVDKLTPTLAGTPVFDFERLDKDGKKVSTELLKGKTYLLDFWGSWCGPCRASHPHLKELYKKYSGKGFEIVAIAQERGKTLDESKANWLKAIKDDQINWVHILNQDGIEKQNIVKMFHISAFPTKILIDSNGKILVRVTSSATDDIDKALEKIYGI
jgi:thiol-disulfide isomerase/thioredoxin